MASPQDYFSPGEMPGVQPDQSLMPQIASIMQDPKALNALLAFGTHAMVPQWGGPAVQFAQGIGGAGEAATAQEAAGQKQQEIESKAGLREAQAGAAEARANTASTRASLTGQIEEGKRDRALTANKVRLTNMYTNYIRTLDQRNKAIEAGNNNPLRPVGTPPTPPERAMPMEEWINSNPLIRNMGLSGPPTAVQPTGEEDPTIPSQAQPVVGSTERPIGFTTVVKSGPHAGKTARWNGSTWELVGG